VLLLAEPFLELLQPLFQLIVFHRGGRFGAAAFERGLQKGEHVSRGIGAQQPHRRRVCQNRDDRFEIHTRHCNAQRHSCFASKN